jgi:hypothetical protein
MLRRIEGTAIATVSGMVMSTLVEGRGRRYEEESEWPTTRDKGIELL